MSHIQCVRNFFSSQIKLEVSQDEMRCFMTLEKSCFAILHPFYHDTYTFSNHDVSHITQHICHQIIYYNKLILISFVSWTVDHHLLRGLLNERSPHCGVCVPLCRIMTEENEGLHLKEYHCGYYITPAMLGLETLAVLQPLVKSFQCFIHSHPKSLYQLSFIMLANYTEIDIYFL